MKKPTSDHEKLEAISNAVEELEQAAQDWYTAYIDETAATGTYAPFMCALNTKNKETLFFAALQKIKELCNSHN